MEVFRNFVAELMSLQKKIYSDYQGDKYVRDRLMTAIDLLFIQVALRDGMPPTDQQLDNRIANTLSEKAGTASSSVDHYGRSSQMEDLNYSMYPLGQSYGRATRPSVKPFGNRGPGEAIETHMADQEALNKENLV